MDLLEPDINLEDINLKDDVMMKQVVDDIIDDVVLGLCFEVHRSCKLGTLFLGDTDPLSQKDHGGTRPERFLCVQIGSVLCTEEHLGRTIDLPQPSWKASSHEKSTFPGTKIVDRPGVDVFGNVPTKKQLECICPNCQRNLAASRFAPHLEKCMGMGRNSSRIASRRSQKVLKDSESRLGSDLLKHDSAESDDDYNDVDWSLYQDKKVKRLKKEKRSNSPRRNKNSRVRNGGLAGGDALGHLPELHIKSERADTPDSLSSYEYMTIEDKKTLLLNTCGVISGHTKKMCTRSHKCPQHSDEQRRQVRQFLLGPGVSVEDDDQVDIDTYVDGDSQSLRESLQWEAASNASSPTDSVSTNNSNSGTKKRHGKSTKSKKRRFGKASAHHLSSVNSNHTNNAYDFE